MSLLNKAATTKDLKGIRVCRGAPFVNHLLFTDDSLIFCKAISSTSQKLLDILQVYAKALSQCINKEKTTMVLSNNTCDRGQGGNSVHVVH